MKRLSLISLVILIISAGCGKKETAAPAEPQKDCEINNKGYFQVANNTTNDWSYKYEDLSGTSLITPIKASEKGVSVELPASQLYDFTVFYRFTFSGENFTWDKYKADMRINQCQTTEVTIEDDCQDKNLGYLIYANNTSGSITVTIDGASYAPIAVNKAEGYDVAAGVTHTVSISSVNGTYSGTPSVGRCQRLAIGVE